MLKPSIFVEIVITIGMHDKLSSKGKRGLKSFEYGLVFCEEREGEHGQICVIELSERVRVKQASGDKQVIVEREGG
jgi:hypothetical protein